MAAPESDPRSPDLKYLSHSVIGIQSDHQLGTMHWVAAADYNGDGIEDLALRHPLGLIGLLWRSGTPAVLFQYNFPIELPADNRTPALGPAADVTGERHPQVQFIARGPEPDLWRYQVYDPPTNAIVRDLELPRGEDIRGDGDWDGSYSIEASIPGAAPSGGPLVILARMVRFDKYQRGLLGLDARTQEILWTFEMGPNPTLGTIHIVDTVGDSTPEIVFAGNSPDNLGGEKINGTSDNESFVFCLDLNGGEIWRRRLGGYFVTPYLQVGNLISDDSIEILAATAYHGSDLETRDTLRLLSGSTGEILAETVLLEACRKLIVLPGDEASTWRVVMGSRADNLFEYPLQDGRFGEGRLADAAGDIYLVDAVDLLPDEEGLELICIREGRTEEGSIQILDQDRNLVAEERLGGRCGGLTYTVWHPESEHAVLLYSTSTVRDALTFELAPSPPLYRRPWVMQMTGVALGGVLLLGWAVRRRSPGSKALESGTARDRLLRLFRELEESSHGTLAATRGVERLVWLLEAYLNGGQLEGPVLGRLHSGLDDFRTSVRPRLEDILAQALQADLPGGAAQSTRTGLDDFDAALASVNLTAPDFATIEKALPTLQASSRRTVEGFRSLKEAVEDCFATDPQSMVLQLLAQLEPDLQDTDVKFEVMPAVAGRNLRCSIDAADLRFILENLLGNALQAMTEAEAQTLTIRFDAELGRLQIGISDTGTGIAPADRELIFENGYSTRDGGGLGLARSREILEFWRGRLELVDSEPGRGSTFRVELPVGRSGEAEGM